MDTVNKLRVHHDLENSTSSMSEDLHLFVLLSLLAAPLWLYVHVCVSSPNS